MKILLVSYSFPPHISPRSLRWAAILRYWVSQGHDVEVICGGSGATNGSENLDGIVVRRCGGSLREALARGAAAGSASGVAKKPGWVLRTVKWLYDRTWKKIYWPDYACSWIVPARRILRRRLEAGGMDAIITTSPPFSGHLTVPVRMVRRQSVKWVVDLGDPFSFSEMGVFNNRALYAGLNARVERQIFAAADYVSVTTLPTRDIYLRLYPELSGKIIVIPPLLSRNPTMLSTMAKEENEKLRLLYVGSFYLGVREPTPLLEFVEQLLARNASLQDAIEVHIYGDTTQFDHLFRKASSAVDKVLVRHGAASHETCLAAMMAADVLINIGNRNRYQLPSKVIEYAATGKPIMNLVMDTEDSSTQFLQSYPLFLELGPEIDAAALEGAEAFILSNRGCTVTPDVLKELVVRHSVPVIAASYLKCLEPNSLKAKSSESVAARVID